MESIYTTSNIIVAFWVSGVFMAYISLWIPAMKIIKLINPNDLAYRYRWIGAIVFIVLTTLALPLMIHIILVDKYRERFLKGFIPAYLGKKDE